MRLLNVGQLGLVGSAKLNFLKKMFLLYRLVGDIFEVPWQLSALLWCVGASGMAQRKDPQLGRHIKI